MNTQPPAPPPGPATPGEQPTFMHHTLPVGTVIGGLQITGLIGEGGFGIVYKAFDPTLQRVVALKEYMPSALAARATNSADVSVKAPRFLDTFNAGLRSFINEARLLAHFDHPALVKVHQFWQANRTAYMVMPFYQGPTLKSHLAAMAAEGRVPDEAQLRQWLEPVLDALEVMHGEQCYHRDIAPDNILLTINGPLLLDFGAARRVISDMTHALTVILKPGYAPIEQYGEVSSMAQGPWTDLYALASVVYFAITGHSPITSVERVMGDPLPQLARIAAGRYSDAFLRAVDAALAVRPSDRPQSVAEFRALLAGHTLPRRTRPQAAPSDATLPEALLPTRVQPRTGGEPQMALDAWAAAPPTVPPPMPPSMAPAATAPQMPRTVPAAAAPASGTHAPSGEAPPSTARRRAPWVAAGVSAAVLLGAIAWVVQRGSGGAGVAGAGAGASAAVAARPAPTVPAAPAIAPTAVVAVPAAAPASAAPVAATVSTPTEKPTVTASPADKPAVASKPADKPADKPAVAAAPPPVRRPPPAVERAAPAPRVARDSGGAKTATTDTAAASRRPVATAPAAPTTPAMTTSPATPTTSTSSTPPRTSTPSTPAAIFGSGPSTSSTPSTTSTSSTAPTTSAGATTRATAPAPTPAATSKTPVATPYPAPATSAQTPAATPAATATGTAATTGTAAAASTAARTAPTTAGAAPASAARATPTGRSPQCAELLRKGAQQPLTLDEATFLRKECR